VLVAYEHDEDSSTITELNINVKKKTVQGTFSISKDKKHTTASDCLKVYNLMIKQSSALYWLCLQFRL